MARERKVGGRNSCGRNGSTVQLWTRGGQNWWGKLCGKHLKEMLGRGWFDKKPAMAQSEILAPLSSPIPQAAAIPKQARIGAMKDRLDTIIKKLEAIPEEIFGDEFDSLIHNALAAVELAKQELEKKP